MDQGIQSGVPFLIVGLVGYLYTAFCMYKIAQKTNTPDGWMAFIPILNIFNFIFVSGKPWWYFILLLIPLVNIVAAIILCINVGKRCGKSGFEGFLLVIPVVNLFVLGHLAFSK